MNPKTPLVCALMTLLLGATPAWPQAVRPAPDGPPAAVAQHVIQENFDPSLCPHVVKAERLGDGSIRATCNNGGIFRVLTVRSGPLAIRCSAVVRMGADGC